ncbi:MAG TPA: IS110 family transposase [Longimicrobiaceae bacterium]
MAFSVGLGQQPRYRSVAARDLAAVRKEIAAAKARFGLSAQARVVSCYEAGRDGFWLDRALKAMGVENLVVDSASIEVNRRARRAKTDRLDGGKLLGLLLRWLAGEEKAWSVVRVPTPEEEDRRHLHREWKTSKRDLTRLTNRIKGLLFGQGIHLSSLKGLPQQLGRLRLWDGGALPVRLRERLERDWEQVQRLRQRLGQLRAERRKLLQTGEDAASRCARKLAELSAIGETGAWAYAVEFFGWRKFDNRRQVGALAGLTPTPYQSGSTGREQGICKAGNRWIRGLVVETAWAWLRYQPQSELSLWYQRRFGSGSARVRKIGIVALARKLLIALWKYVESDTLPAGAVRKALVEQG